MADEIANLTLEILKRVQADVSGLKREVGELRGEVGELRRDLVGLRGEMHGEVAGVRGEMRGQVGELRKEFGELRADLRTEIDGLRAEMRQGFNDSAARDAALDARISRLDAETTRGFQMVFQELRGHRDFATETLRDHEQRIRKLEERLPREPER